MTAKHSEGSIVCVGTGIMLGAHISPLCQSHIEQADIVFCAVANDYMRKWLFSLNHNVVDLQKYYSEGKNRRQTYREMETAILHEVRAGKRVVGAFYGHPGVFARVPHTAITQATKEGFEAYMLPGISAEACLYADLGIDPGACGCLHYEASQFLRYQHAVNTASHLVLWQVGVAGDFTTSKFVSSAEQRDVLARKLQRYYSPEHEVILYEAAVLPIDKHRAHRLPLKSLSTANIEQHTTLVVPPAHPLKEDTAFLDAL